MLVARLIGSAIVGAVVGLLIAQAFPNNPQIGGIPGAVGGSVLTFVLGAWVTSSNNQQQHDAKLRDY